MIVLGAGTAVLPGGAVFVVVGLGAFFLPILARRLRLPSVVLEIVFGVLIGPAVFGLIASRSAGEGFLLVLAELGLFLLMFLAGFEIDFTRLEREGPMPVVWGLVYFGIVVALSWIGFGMLSFDGLDQRLFMTLLVSAASLGIIVPALRASGLTNTRLGQTVIVAGVLAEVLAAASLVVLGIVVEFGVGLRLLGLPLFVAVLGVTLAVMRRVAWWYPERAERLFSEHDPDEMGIRASLALLFVFVGVSLALGIDPILGAFFAGALFRYVFRDTGALEARLTGFAYGFFIPIFFIAVGIRFPLEALADTSVLLGALALIGVAVAAKLLAAPVFALRGLGLREIGAAGALLAGQLSVTIALAEFGVEIGIIDDRLAAGAVLLVGVTAIVSPVAFRLVIGDGAPPGDERRGDELV